MRCIDIEFNGGVAYKAVVVKTESDHKCTIYDAVYDETDDEIVCSDDALGCWTGRLVPDCDDLMWHHSVLIEVEKGRYMAAVGMQVYEFDFDEKIERMYTGMNSTIAYTVAYSAKRVLFLMHDEQGGPRYAYLEDCEILDEREAYSDFYNGLKESSLALDSILLHDATDRLT